MKPDPAKPGQGGVIHSYQKYDPRHFPSPTAPPPDLASAALEHMLFYGNTRRLTPEELANAIHIDISQIAGLGPSLESLIQKLLERKRKILETYETRSALAEAGDLYKRAVRHAKPPNELRPLFKKVVDEEQVRDFEKLFYAMNDDTSPFARELVGLIERLGDKYQVEALASKYEFTGREAMDVPTALEVKEELEAIDRLIEQLKEAMKNAQVAVIDLDELAQFADEADVEQLRQMREQIESYMRQEAERQGLEADKGAFNLTPQTMKLFQSRLLTEIFDSLQAARSGRHSGPIYGEGAVESMKTKAYEFGDSASHVDVAQSLVNTVARTGGSRVGAEDLEIHLTRNNPKCATSVLLDMSGSMRHNAQYVNAKRMALALDALIRREYPGDHLSFFEVASFAKQRHFSELAALLPKPVTIHSPRVRLKADMSRKDITEIDIPPHFTNIQHALQLARRVLGVQDTPNKQIILLTDGLPTAHFEGTELFLIYPPDPRTEEATMREARQCARDGIIINIFLLPSWSQSSEDVAFARQVAEQTGGRVFFTAGNDVDRFVLWDYVSHRRKVIG